MARTPSETINDRAARQHRLLARAQAYEAGLNARQVRYRVQRRQWRETRHDVFNVDGRAIETWHASLMAVVLCVPGAVVSHRTALRLHGNLTLHDPEDPGLIEVTAPHGHHVKLDGVVVHQSRSLLDIDRETVDGIPVTSGERTMIDLAPALVRADRLELLDELIIAEVVHRRRFHGRATALHHGRAGLDELIDVTAPGGEQRFRSMLELEADRQWTAAGLPPRRWNVRLHDARGLIGTIDAVFEPHRLVTTELDGLRFHSSPRQRRKDNARDRRLLLSGRVPLRYTYRDIMGRPDDVVAQLREALAQAERRAS
jgi:hypothetical protein